MRRFLIALALAALPAAAQDDARIKELILKLDDDGFEAREQAEKELVAIGEPALPLLRKAAEEAEKRKDGGEVKVRTLSALRAIEFAAKARQVYVEPKKVTLKLAETELGRVLDEIAKQTGVKFDASSVDGRAIVSVDAKDAPLFKVLDDLCRGQDERTYEFREEGVKFQKEPHRPYPTAYEGPFRIRIVRLKQERSTDFKARTAQIQLSLEADWQKHLSPSKRYEIEVRKAVDDKGGTLEVRKGEDWDDPNGVMVAGGARIVMMKRAVMMAGGAGGALETVQPFTLKGLTSGATRVTLQGVAKFTFPLDKTDVKFEKPGASETREAGDYSIALKNLASGRLWTLTFARAKGKGDAGSVEDIDGRLDKESMVAVDEDGAEHKATLIPTTASGIQIMVGPGGVVQPEGTPLATYQVMFPALRNKPIKELRFKFVGQAFVKQVPFAFEGLELP